MFNDNNKHNNSFDQKESVNTNTKIPSKMNRNKSNRKKRNKRNKTSNKLNSQQLKQQRQESLLALGNNLMSNLDAKYAPYFDEEMQEIWKNEMTEYITFYQHDNSDIINDIDLFNEKKTEMRQSWQDLFELIEEDYNNAQKQEAEAKALHDRQQKVAAMRASGLNIRGNTDKPPTKHRWKSNKKKEEKNKLKALRKRLAEMDKIAVQQEQQKKDEVQIKVKEEKEVITTTVNDNWDDDSSSDEDHGQEIQHKNKNNVQQTDDPFASDDDDVEPPQQHNVVKQRKEQRTKPRVNSSEEDEEKGVNDGEKKKKKLRAPICVVLGHVDAGKTKILDHIRNSSVQSKEIGGITQQIGVTNLSIDYIKQRTENMKQYVHKLKYKLPGLCFIDTPGHESFSNLRSRGTSMCDIAVLVVDLLSGLEPQTIESMNMLRQNKVPFVVALNKIDRCYNWESHKDAPFLSTYNKQSKTTKNHFDKRLNNVLIQFAAQGMNAKLYTENKKLDRDISIVPTSAITGEGIPDLLYLIVYLAQKYMTKQVKFDVDKIEASVLEVKQVQGFGATIDVIVSNGTLRKDDTIVVCGMNGAIVAPIRALLLPHEAQDMRDRAQYRSVPSVSASAGVRVAAAEDLSTAVAGAPLFVVPRDLKAVERREVIECLCDEVQQSFADLFSKVDKGGRGVFVQASTLGSLEALIEFLSSQNIPISGIDIGTISRKTIMKAAVMFNFQPEYAAILAFNVKCAPDARTLAHKLGVRIFEAEIIYHLQEMFEEYIDEIKSKGPSRDEAVFPVEFKIISPEHVFHNKNPLILGVEITRGSLRLNTPIVAQRWDEDGHPTPIYLGKVDSIKSDATNLEIASVGDRVSVRIQDDEQQTNTQVGRTFDITDSLISKVSRESIDALKANFKQQLMSNNDTIRYLVALKRYFGII